MMEAIKRPSDAIRGHHGKLDEHLGRLMREAIRGSQTLALRGTQRHSEALRGTQRHSEALRGNQRQSAGRRSPHATPPRSSRRFGCAVG